MNNTGNITIVLLVVTAAILTAMLVGTYLQTTQTARAEGPDRVQDRYIICSGEFNVNVSLTYVINVREQQLNVYWANYKTESIDLIDTVDLNALFSR